MCNRSKIVSKHDLQRGETMMRASIPLTIVAICNAAPGQEDELRTAQQRLVAETVKEPGCVRYELHQSIQDPRLLIFVESWASEEQWQNHMQGAAIKHFHSSGAANLLVDFSMFRMNLVSDGGRC